MLMDIAVEVAAAAAAVVVGMFMSMTVGGLSCSKDESSVRALGAEGTSNPDLQRLNIYSEPRPSPHMLPLRSRIDCNQRRLRSTGGRASNFNFKECKNKRRLASSREASAQHFSLLFGQAKYCGRILS